MAKKVIDVTPDGLDELEREWRYYSPDGGKDIVAVIAEVRRLRARYVTPLLPSLTRPTWREEFYPESVSFAP